MPQVRVPDSPSLVVESWISSLKAGASPTVKIVVKFASDFKRILLVLSKALCHLKMQP